MLDEQEDESLGVEQLPQSELEAVPGGESEQPFEPEAVHTANHNQSSIAELENEQSKDEKSGDRSAKQ